MRILGLFMTIVLLVGCAATAMRGTISNGYYSNIQGTFSMDIPQLPGQKIIDGFSRHLAYVDFIADTKAYSIEFFANAGPDSEVTFKSGTESFMADYIPEKCGPGSFDAVEGQFSTISNQLSYDFVTQGVRPNGKNTFWYGRSIYLAPNKVAICMYYEDRAEGETIEDFEKKFNKSEFDQVCSSIKVKA